MRREQESRPSTAELISSFQSVQTRRLCLHPDASEKECEGKIVQAHTVQKELLRKIAREGKVYGFSLHMGSLFSSDGAIRPQLIGISRASTFTGFCQKHDDLLFADIEKKPICATERHAYLLSYRSLAREQYAKEAAVLLEPHRRTMDRGLPLHAQVEHQAHNAAVTSGASTALKEIMAKRSLYEDALRRSDYSAFRYLVVWFDRIPDILCAGTTYPKWDFCGTRLQDLRDLDTPLQDITLSLVASGERGCAYFSWFAQEKNDPSTSLVRSLVSLPSDQLPHAIVRLVLSSFENQFWRPDWWESHSEELQKRLIRRLAVAVHPSTKLPPDYLEDDGVRVVDWQVVDIETNIAGLI